MTEQAEFNERVAIIHKEMEGFPHPKAVTAGVLHYLAVCYISCMVPDASDASRHSAIKWATQTVAECVAFTRKQTAEQTGRAGLFDTRIFLHTVALEAMRLLTPHLGKTYLPEDFEP